MALIYLRHPLHGEKVACSDGEAMADQTNGWVVFDPSVKPDPVVDEPTVEKVKRTSKAKPLDLPAFLTGNQPTS